MFYGLYKGKKLIEFARNRAYLIDFASKKAGFGDLILVDDIERFFLERLEPLGYRISKVKIIEIR